MRTPKPRPCRSCKTLTTNKIGLRILCDINCALAYTRSEAQRKQLKQKAEIRRNERQKTKTAKERLKPLSKWLGEAQTVINAYVRLRDADKPCISCNCLSAGQWDCGHYRSRAAASHLRFNLNNMARQCSVCNQHKSGNAIEFRIGLIKRIGEAAVIELENDNRIHKFTVEEAKQIKAEYLAKCRALIRRGQNPAPNN